MKNHQDLFFVDKKLRNAQHSAHVRRQRYIAASAVKAQNRKPDHWDFGPEEIWVNPKSKRDNGMHEVSTTERDGWVHAINSAYVLDQDTDLEESWAEYYREHDHRTLSGPVVGVAVMVDHPNEGQKPGMTAQEMIDRLESMDNDSIALHTAMTYYIKNPCHREMEVFRHFQ